MNSLYGTKPQGVSVAQISAESVLTTQTLGLEGVVAQWHCEPILHKTRQNYTPLHSATLIQSHAGLVGADTQRYLWRCGDFEPELQLVREMCLLSSKKASSALGFTFHSSFEIYSPSCHAQDLLVWLGKHTLLKYCSITVHKRGSGSVIRDLPGKPVFHTADIS